MAIVRRGPPTGGVERREYEKSRFSTNISEMKQDRAVVTVQGD